MLLGPAKEDLLSDGGLGLDNNDKDNNDNNNYYYNNNNNDDDNDDDDDTIKGNAIAITLYTQEIVLASYDVF